MIPKVASSSQSKNQILCLFVLVAVALVSHQLGYYSSCSKSCDCDKETGPTVKTGEEKVALPPLVELTVLGDDIPAPLPDHSYRVVVVSDRDTNSAYGPNLWISNLRIGVLRKTSNNKYKISWEKETILQTTMNEKGRGLELSELVYWNGDLLTFDDRTGIVFEIVDGDVLPRYILNDGDGDEAKGFKSEWATLKGNELYVGSIGKEWTTGDGVVVNNNPEYIKVIDVHGEIRDVDWISHYDALKEKAGCPSPGYMVHEAAVWNNELRQWFFLPRRVSKERYDEKLDEHRGSNLMLIANEDFTSITEKHIGPLIPTHGFSSVKFVPGSSTDMVALKSEEADGVIATYMMVFNLSGDVLMNEVKIGDVKYEGVEFVPDEFDII